MPVVLRTLAGLVPPTVAEQIRDLVLALNQAERELIELRARPIAIAAAATPATTLAATRVSTGAALDGNGTVSQPLAVQVDGSSVIVNANNQLEAPAAGGGITELTGDVTAGPGSGSEVATLANSGVGAGTYGDATNVAQVTVDSKGRVTAAANVAIAASGGAPTTAEYLVGALHAGLSAERLVTDTPTVAWDLTTPGQAAADVVPAALNELVEVAVDPAGALDGTGLTAAPLAVRVDGSTIQINGSNELEAVGGGGGITQLTGDGTAGPGSGAQVFTLANTAVTPGTYGDATNVGQFTVDSKGRIIAAANVAISGSVGSGTSFPVSPSTGDLFWRTDRNIEYVYDGTRWLSTVVYSLPINNFDVTGVQPKTATTSAFAAAPWTGVYDLYVETGTVVTFNTATTSTNYFTFQFSKWDAGTQTSIGSSISGQGNPINVFVAQSVTINAVMSGVEAFGCTCTETGADTCHIYPALTYRLVG